MHLSAGSIPSSPDSEKLTSIGNIDDLEKVLPEILALPEDEKFVGRVYGLMLRRQPDQVGLSTHLGRLAEGCPRKVVLFQIAASAEAKSKNLHIPMPLAVKLSAMVFLCTSRIKKIPVISKLLLWPYRMIRLPTAFYKISKDFQIAQQQIRNLQGESRQRGKHLSKLLTEIERIRAHEEHGFADLKNSLSEVKNSLSEISVAITDLRARSVYPIINAGANGFVMRIEDFIFRLPGTDWRMAAYMAYSGHLEPGLVKVFKTKVKEGMVVVDVGASIGVYTLIAGLQVGPLGRVFSFEPTPATFEALKDNVEVNGLLQSGHVVLNLIAVTDKKGAARLSVYDENFGHNTLYPKFEDARFVDVETTSLDKILKDVAKIDVVKIDAEGAEPFILRGMKTIIDKNPDITIFMEFAPSHLERAGVGPSAFIDEISGYGFSMRRIDDLSGNAFEISDQELVTSFSVNLMLTRENG